MAGRAQNLEIQQTSVVQQEIHVYIYICVCVLYINIYIYVIYVQYININLHQYIFIDASILWSNKTSGSRFLLRSIKRVQWFSLFTLQSSCESRDFLPYFQIQSYELRRVVDLALDQNQTLEINIKIHRYHLWLCYQVPWYIMWKVGPLYICGTSQVRFKDDSWRTAWKTPNNWARTNTAQVYPRHAHDLDLFVQPSLHRRKSNYCRPTVNHPLKGTINN